MAKIRDILTRRKTARNIRKITRTMEMISTSRYRRVQGWVTGLHPYTEGLDDVVRHLARHAGGRRHPQPLLAERPHVARDALLVLASNRGMCAGYNGSVVRLALGRIRALADEGRQVDVYAVGARVLAGLREAGIQPVWYARQYEGRVPMADVADLADLLMERFTADQVGTVQTVYTRFLSPGAQRTAVQRLLPLGELIAPRPGELDEVSAPPRYDFMPADPQRILELLLPRTVVVRLYQAFLDALASEHMARMTAMRAATENAEDMAHRLTLAYNRARQGGITRELAEIVGGAEAMK